ncbi:MAG: signal recognition particle-docking protein FtsY [Lachnospiraceae bacterium]|nr:signal recognition particle-docking protein FtsY [Lachnospiraceae bacterium]
MGFFDKLKAGLSKTRDQLAGGMDNLINGYAEIDEDFYDELEETLIMGDLGVESTGLILEELKDVVKERRVRESSGVKELLAELITNRLTLPEDAYEYTNVRSVVLVVGVNGVGKTTTCGKLAAKLSDKGKKVLLCAADTFRAAAGEQLKAWAGRAGVDIVSGAEGQDPGAVVFDGVSAAKARGTDVLLVDTAGRLNNKKNLMEELRKIKNIIAREYPEAKLETLVVVDASTGQNALVQAQEFASVTDVTGVVLTKLDGTAKGGIVVAIASQLGIPVKYIGIGEAVEDLERFDADSYVKAILG